MSKTFYLFGMAMLILLSPSYAFGQASVLDEIDTSNLELSTLGTGLIDSYVLGRSVLPSDSGTVLAGGDRRRTHLRARYVYHDNNYNYYPPQAYAKQESVPTASLQDSGILDTNDTVVEEERTESIFGIGICIGGYYPGKLTSRSGEDLDFKVSSSGGFYIKLRPVRWISLESIINLMLGKDELGNSYVAAPLSLGLRIHVFDYGMLDVYGVAAAHLNFSRFASEFMLQTGGQFGAGVSIILSFIELGFDLRYTVNAPVESPRNDLGVPLTNHGTQHGVLFGTQIGLAF